MRQDETHVRGEIGRDLAEDAELGARGDLVVDAGARIGELRGAPSSGLERGSPDRARPRSGSDPPARVAGP